MAIAVKQIHQRVVNAATTNTQPGDFIVPPAPGLTRVYNSSTNPNEIPSNSKILGAWWVPNDAMPLSNGLSIFNLLGVTFNATSVTLQGESVNGSAAGALGIVLCVLIDL